MRSCGAVRGRPGTCGASLRVPMVILVHTYPWCGFCTAACRLPCPTRAISIHHPSPARLISPNLSKAPPRPQVPATLAHGAPPHDRPIAGFAAASDRRPGSWRVVLGHRRRVRTRRRGLLADITRRHLGRVCVRFSGAAMIKQYIVFVGARYKHIRCTNSKLQVLYTHDPPAK